MIDWLLIILQAWQQTGPAGLAGLACVFMVGALAYVPRFTLCLVGGMVFGFAAAPVAIIGSTAGSVAAFWLSRYALRDWFLRRVVNRPSRQAVLAAVDAEGWRLVLLFRLVAPLPGGMTSYLFGLTRIGAWPFTAATCAGLVPPVVIFVSLGALGRMTLEDAQGSWGRSVAILAGLTVLAIAIMLVMRRLRASAAAALAASAASRG